MPDRAQQRVVVTFSRQPSVAYFLKGVLDCAGFEVTAVSSNLDDLEAAVQRTRPDAIVYDVGCPCETSWQALQQFRERTALRSTPIVITTSEAHGLSQAPGASAAVEIFSRPDDVVELRRVVQNTIESAGHAA